MRIWRGLLNLVRRGLLIALEKILKVVAALFIITTNFLIVIAVALMKKLTKYLSKEK